MAERSAADPSPAQQIPRLREALRKHLEKPLAKGDAWYGKILFCRHR